MTEDSPPLHVEAHEHFGQSGRKWSWRKEGRSWKEVGLACCSPPYSPRMTGQGPVQTHCCLKCSLVCWPPGLPGKEESLSLRPRSPPAIPSAPTYYAMHCKAVMRSHVLILAHLWALKQVPRLPPLYSGDCLQDCRKAYTRPSVYTEALRLAARTITRVSSFLQLLTLPPSIIPGSRLPRGELGTDCLECPACALPLASFLSSFSSFSRHSFIHSLLLQQNSFIHSFTVSPADIHSFIHCSSSRHSFVHSLFLQQTGPHPPPD